MRVHEVNSGLDCELWRAPSVSSPSCRSRRSTTACNARIRRLHARDDPRAGFLSPVAVTLAGIPAKVISVSATELLVLPARRLLHRLHRRLRRGRRDQHRLRRPATGSRRVTTRSPSASRSSCCDLPAICRRADRGHDFEAGPRQHHERQLSAPSPRHDRLESPIRLGRRRGPGQRGGRAALPAGTLPRTLVNVRDAVDATVTSSLTTCTTTATGLFPVPAPCRPSAEPLDRQDRLAEPGRHRGFLTIHAFRQQRRAPTGGQSRR